MANFTLDHLARILYEGAGEAEQIDWSPDVLDMFFEDLGYDSVAMLETAGRVQQEFGVRIDDDLTELRTPGRFINHVNQLISAR